MLDFYLFYFCCYFCCTQFLIDLVICSRTCNHKPLMNFILRLVLKKQLNVNNRVWHMTVLIIDKPMALEVSRTSQRHFIDRVGFWGEGPETGASIQKKPLGAAAHNNNNWLKASAVSTEAPTRPAALPPCLCSTHSAYTLRHCVGVTLILILWEPLLFEEGIASHKISRSQNLTVSLIELKLNK